MIRFEFPHQIQRLACSDGGLRRLGFEVVAAVRVGAVRVGVACNRTVDRENRLGRTVSGRGARVALHAGLCPERRPLTWLRKVAVGVRSVAAEEEKGDANHLGGEVLSSRADLARCLWLGIVSIYHKHVTDTMNQLLYVGDQHIYII